MQSTATSASTTGSGRVRAALIHLALSAAVFVVLAALIAVWLFPGELFSSAGGLDGIRLIAGVDLVLGPLLTLIVFNRAKPRKEIVRDLSVIGVIQFAALASGMWIVYQQRPLTVTWAHDRFVVLTANEYRAADVAPEDLPGLDPLTPVFGHIELPEDPAMRNTVLASYAMTGDALHMRVSLFRPMPDEAATRDLLRFSATAADASGQCVNVGVITRFGDFEHCYDPVQHRFEAANANRSGGD